MGKISTIPRYMIDITGTDPVSGVVGGGINYEKLEKMRYFNLRTGDRISMKCDI